MSVHVQNFVRQNLLSVFNSVNAAIYHWGENVGCALDIPLQAHTNRQTQPLMPARSVLKVPATIL